MLRDSGPKRRLAVWLTACAGAAALLLAIGCQEDEPAFRARLSVDSDLYPPLELARTNAGDLIALAAEGPERTLAFYRSADDGRTWERWTSVPAPPTRDGRVDLAVGGSHLAVLTIEDRQLWTGTVLATNEASPSWATKTFTTDLPIQSAGIALVAPDAETTPAVHVVYLTGPPEDSLRTMAQVRSPDAGATWLAPQVITAGVIDGVTLETRPDGLGSVDIGYRRGRLYRWRAISGADTTDEFRIKLQVAPGSRNRLARLERNVIASGESQGHQAVCAYSDNAGRNWGRAMALARESESRRDADIDAGFGLYWVTYVAHDSVLVVRTTADPRSPRNWSPGIWIARGEIVGYPYIVAMPDSSAGVLHAAPEGRVFFSRVQKPED